MAATDPRTGPRILGLTGPIACGKSTVGDFLLELGAAERIDADRVVHELSQPGTETTAMIAREFGDDILQADGAVDRGRLGTLVFSDTGALRRLEAITHPAVRRVIRTHLQEYAGTPSGVVVLDAIKLLQSELLEIVDAVWVVTCARDVEMKRLSELRSMAVVEAEARLEAMPPFAHSRVTEVIDNSGTIEELRAQVEAAWQRFLAERRAPLTP
jgi:dephospho-CoA kinase